MESRSIEPKPEPIPRIAWMLLAAAAAAFAIFVIRDWYRLFGPYVVIRPERVIEAATVVAPLLVAAAVLVGAVRWPSGRRWLAWGAAAFALHGLLDAAYSGWSAWWETSPGPIGSPAEGLLLARAWTSLAAGVAGPALLGVGLWATRQGTEAMGIARMVATAAIGLIGSVAMAGGFALAAGELGQLSTSGFSGVPLISGAAYSIGLTLAAGSTALLGISALRAMPAEGPLPERVIATGSALAAIVPAWTTWALVIVPLDVLGPHVTWVFVVPSGIGAIGLLLLAAGFALGRATPRSLERH